MAADKQAVIKAVKQAIRETTEAPRPTKPPYPEFAEIYGPGLKEGQFFVHGGRYSHSTTHETVIVVNVVPDCTNPPYKRAHLDTPTRRIFEAVEAEFREAGATLHHEGKGNDGVDAPYRWFMTWVWDSRD